MGIFQANVGIWQILARQGQIKTAAVNESWQSVIKPFGKIASSPQLFDAGQDSLAALLLAATGKRTASQDEIIDLMAGPKQLSPDGQRIHQEVANGIRSVMDGQRPLVSLDTILALGDGLEAMSRGAAVGDTLIPLAGELREFEMPRPIFSSGERTQWATGVYNNRHTDLQMRTDLTKVIKSPGSKEQLADARGQICPFFRDTLVGLNYAYYEPPGAQDSAQQSVTVVSRPWRFLRADTVAGVELRLASFPIIWRRLSGRRRAHPAGSASRSSLTCSRKWNRTSSLQRMSRL